MVKKWIVFPIIISMIVIGTGLSNPQYNGLLLKDSYLYKNIEIQSMELIKDIIVIPEDRFNEVEVREIIDRIAALPTVILQDMKQKGMKVILFTGKLTDNPSAAHLEGIVPRGYPPDIVWDDLPGIGGSKLILIKIGHSEQGEGHGSINLEYHEIAHSIYNYMQNDSIMADITLAWEQEAKALFPEQSYFLNYKEEYFAESFALYFISKENRMKLKQLAPDTYASLSDYINR